MTYKKLIKREPLYCNYRSIRGEEGMDKYTFASVLKEHITESKLSIASLSRLSDVNRTMIQKYISGTQLPANHEILGKILNHLALTNSQKEELSQLYKIERIGLDTYKHLLNLDSFISQLSIHNQSQAKCHIQVHFNQPMTQATNKEELKMLLFTFLSSLNNKTVDIILNMNDTLYPIILPFIKERKLDAHIILCLSNQSTHYSMNLFQLEKLLPLLKSNHVSVHYTYIDCPTRYSLYPFSISSKDKLLLINNDISQGLLINQSNNQKEFNDHFINTSLFVESYYNDIAKLNGLLTLSNENQKVCCYCGDLFLLPYIDEQLLESHYIGNEAYKEELFYRFKSFKENQFQLYCQSPIITEHYLPLGLPSTLFKPFTTKEIQSILLKMLEDIPYNTELNLFKNNILDKDVVIMTGTTGSFISNHSLSFTVLESTINRSLNLLPLLFKELKESVYTKEESIFYLQSYIKE